MASADWLAKVSRRSQVSSREAARASAGGRPSAPTIRSSRSIGTATTRPPARLVEAPQVRVERRPRRRSATCSGLALRGGPADERLVRARCACGAAPPRSVGARAECGPDVELLAARRRTRRSSRRRCPTARPRASTIVASTWSRSRLELTASPTSAERLELLDLAAPAPPAGPRARAPGRPVGWRSRPGRRRSSELVSRSPKGSTSVRQTDRTPTSSSSSEHRHADDRCGRPAEPLGLEAAVLGIGEDVGDLLGTPLEAHPTHQRPSVDSNGVAIEEVEVFVREPREAGQAELVPLEQVELRSVGLAQPPGALDDGPEHQVQVGGDRPRAVRTSPVAASCWRASSRSRLSRAISASSAALCRLGSSPRPSVARRRRCDKRDVGSRSRGCVGTWTTGLLGGPNLAPAADLGRASGRTSAVGRHRDGHGGRDRRHQAMR